jgi:hypothetical protein
VHNDWDAARMREQVIASQQRRNWIKQAEQDGPKRAWDVAPSFDPSQQYVRQQNAQKTNAARRVPHRGSS